MGKYATKEQLTALVADMASKINIASGTQGVSGSYVPIGCIEAFMGTEAPPDFLVCDGSLHSIVTYPQLADHFYEQFGASNHFGGNGTTTFAVPDLRGEFLRGTGTNGHENQGDGANVGKHQDGSTILGYYVGSETQGQFQGSNETNVLNADKINTVKNTHSIVFSGNIALTNKVYNRVRPTNTSVLWCIKAIDEKFNPNYIEYSTEEKMIGTWIDGKGIYQKTYDMGTDKSISLNEWTDTGIIVSSLNIDKLIACTCTSTGPSQGIPNGITTGVKAYIRISDYHIMLQTLGSYSDSTRYLTIQYTKTS